MFRYGNDVKQFYMCSCFYTDNIFLEEYKLHVRYVSRQQFTNDYKAILRTRGCTTDAVFDMTVKKIEDEVDRRRHLCISSSERAALIKAAYQPLKPKVYCLQESYLAPRFVQIVHYCQSDGATIQGLFENIKPLAAQRVYQLPVFTYEFCQKLIEELEHFEKSDFPKGRPNSMNNYGILLNELGFDENFLTPLREKYIQPITALLYHDYGGQNLDSHKAFVVKYTMREDLDVSYHYDNAEITLNICLGKDFTEGNLYFGDMREVPLAQTECTEVEHHIADGVLHRGQQMHGALPITSGQRWNLIVWMRASAQRNRLCPMCSQPPRLVPAHGFADGFTQIELDNQKDVCSLN